jgi:hypothetical protein
LNLTSRSKSTKPDGRSLNKYMVQRLAQTHKELRSHSRSKSIIQSDSISASRSGSKRFFSTQVGFGTRNTDLAPKHAYNTIANNDFSGIVNK